MGNTPTYHLLGKYILIALSLVGMAACDSSDSETVIQKQSSRSGAIHLAESLTNAQEGIYADSFKLLAQRDIVVRIEVPVRLLEPQLTFAKLEILNPEQVPHMTRMHAISLRPSQALASRPDNHGQLPVQQAELRRGKAIYYLKIPVAGTNFTRYRLHGLFTATITLGTETTVALASQTFRIDL